MDLHGNAKITQIVQSGAESRLPKEAKLVLLFCGAIEENRPLACLTQQVHPNETMPPPRAVGW
jgi:hypothetical protein